MFFDFPACRYAVQSTKIQRQADKPKFNVLSPEEDVLLLRWQEKNLYPLTIAWKPEEGCMG